MFSKTLKMAFYCFHIIMFSAFEENYVKAYAIRDFRFFKQKISRKGM